MRWTSLLLLLLLSACTLPVQDRENNSFVSSKEQDAIQLVREGNDYFLQGRFIPAELKYRQAMFLFPQADNIKVNLANTLLKTGQFDEGLSMASDLLEKEPENIDYLLLAAKIHLERNKIDRAIERYNDALSIAREKELKKYEVKILDNLSALYFNIGEEEQALCYALQSFSLEKNPFKKGKFARLQTAYGLKDKMDIFPEQQNLNKNEEDFLFWRMQLAYAGRDYEQAKEILSQIKLLNHEVKELSTGIRFFDLLLNQPEDMTDKEKTEIIESLAPEEKIIDEVSLYWAADIIGKLEEYVGTIQSKSFSLF